MGREARARCRPPREPRPGQLRDVHAPGVLRVEIGVARVETQVGERPKFQLALQTLGARGAEVKRVELPVEPDQVREVVVEKSGRDFDPIFPRELLDTDLPAELFFGIELELVPENLVLAARRP